MALRLVVFFVLFFKFKKIHIVQVAVKSCSSSSRSILHVCPSPEILSTFKSLYLSVTCLRFDPKLFSSSPSPLAVLFIAFPAPIFCFLPPHTLAWFYSRVSSLGGQTKNPSHLTSPLAWAVSSLLQGFSGRGSKANPASICSLHVLPQHVLKSTLHSPYKPSPNSICTSSSSSRPDQALYNHDVHHLFFHFWATESASQQLCCLGLSPKGEDILRPLSKPT